MEKWKSGKVETESLQPPVVGAQGADARRVGGVSGWIGDACEVEGFAAFNAGAAAAAVKVAALVAGPRFRKGQAQFCAAAHDIGFGPVDEGAAELDRAPVAQTYGFGHGVGKLVAAIGVDRVVAAVGSVSDLLSANRKGMPGGDGEQDHISIWHHGGLHRLLGVVAFGNVDFGRG